MPKPILWSLIRKCAPLLASIRVVDVWPHYWQTLNIIANRSKNGSPAHTSSAQKKNSNTEDTHLDSIQLMELLSHHPKMNCLMPYEYLLVRQTNRQPSRKTITYTNHLSFSFQPPSHRHNRNDIGRQMKRFICFTLTECRCARVCLSVCVYGDPELYSLFYLLYKQSFSQRT